MADMGEVEEGCFSATREEDMGDVGLEMGSFPLFAQQG